MSAAAVVLLAASALMFGTGPVALLVAKVRASRDARAEANRRAEQGREVTPEWLAVLAAVEPTPMYDRLVCEQMERENGWVA